MATTVNSDMIVYNDLAQTAYLERIQGVIDVFNASSNGALILDNELIEGELYNEGGRSFLMTGANGGSVTPLRRPSVLVLFCCTTCTGARARSSFSAAPGWTEHT